MFLRYHSTLKPFLIGLASRAAQQAATTSKIAASAAASVPGTEKDYLQQRRDLAVEFLFCLCLVEVLKQFHYHPGNDDLVSLKFWY